VGTLLFIGLGKMGRFFDGFTNFSKKKKKKKIKNGLFLQKIENQKRAE
jgi:hypothetical protein